MPVTERKDGPAYLREARLRAGCVNRGTAATRVPFSPETIGRHERGEVQINPEDVVQYAKGYERSEMLYQYCADCPVGRQTGRTATDRPLPFATLRVSRMIDEAQKVADRLEQIAFDGVIDESEKEDFGKALQMGVAAGSATAFSGWLGTRALTEELMERVKVEKIPL